MHELSYMEIAVYVQSVCLSGTGGLHGADSVLLVVTHGVVYGDECRQIATGLAGQVGVEVPEVTLAA